jgi:hypothetical protein
MYIEFLDSSESNGWYCLQVSETVRKVGQLGQLGRDLNVTHNGLVYIQ